MALSRRTNREIRRLAAELLYDHGREEDIPVDVDELAEYDLGIRIETRAGLHADKGIEGAIAKNLKTIYLDNELFHKNIRWRVTIAHEIAHAVLHADFIGSLECEDDQSWKVMTLEISDADNDVLEAEAQVFADALLVPDASLTLLHAQIIDELKKAGREISELSAASKVHLAGNIARQLEVTTRMVERRLSSLSLDGWGSEADNAHLLPGFRSDKESAG